MPGGRWEIGIWLDFFRKYWANYVLFCLYKKKNKFLSGNPKLWWFVQQS